MPKRKSSNKAATETRERVVLADGRSFSVERLQLHQLTDARVEHFRGCRWVAVDKGWLYYQKNPGDGVLFAKTDFDNLWKSLKGQLANLERYIHSLDPIEREFLWDLERFRVLEGGLEHPVWARTRSECPEIYVRLIKNVMLHPNLQQMTENVEDGLNRRSLSWVQIESVRHIDQGSIAVGVASRGGFERIMSQGISEWRRFDRAVKLLTNEDSPFPLELKVKIKNEHEKLRAATEQYPSLVDVNLELAFQEIVGSKPKSIDDDSPKRLRISDFLNVFIVRIVEELLGNGLSKKRSYLMTDTILHILLPEFWNAPDEFSHQRVRQRYTYWSKKNRT